MTVNKAQTKWFMEGVIGLLNSAKRKLRSILARRLQVPEIPVALARLKKQGFEPRLIFDVGAYRGDFARECLANWPTSKIACFEPQAHMQTELEGLPTDRVSIFRTLLGSSEKQGVHLHCAETASSVLSEHYNKHPIVSVAQTSIDIIIEKFYDGVAPDFIKADVQGYELEVLRGATKTLKNVSLLLLEINLIEIHQNVPLLHTVVEFLSERGFVAFDVCGLGRRPRDNALWQMDMLFVPIGSSLRSDKHWD